jgi:hypothetical protein
MQALKELWTQQETPEARNTYLFVLELKQRLEETCKVARESLEESQQSYKHHYDKSSRPRSLKVGDKVLVLLPTSNNKMMLQCKGPYEVVEVVNKMDYRVKVENRIATYHINLLKRYEVRTDVFSATVAIIEPESDDYLGAVDDETSCNCQILQREKHTKMCK